MMHAYDKIYLDKARINLGRMLDFAVYDLKYDLTDFFQLFINSKIANRFEDGDFTVLVGMSGVELAFLVLETSKIEHQRIKPNYTANRSEEYWTGWALAFYQWETSLSFAEITKYIPINEIKALYSPYHEMDSRHFVAKMNKLYKAAKTETNLKLIRQKTGLSQRQLAEESGIPLRTLQQYEQKQKNINKAQAETLVILAKTLCCTVEDLLEKVA